MNPSTGKLRAIVPAEMTGLRPPSEGGSDRLRASVLYDTSEVKIEYLRLLRRHRFAVMTILALCLLVGSVYALFGPKSYRSETVIEITGINQDFMNTRDADPYAGGVTPDAYLETQIMLLKNEAVADRVVAVMAPKVPPAF